MILKINLKKLQNLKKKFSNLKKCDILCICAIYRNNNIFNTIFENITKKFQF